MQGDEPGQPPVPLPRANWPLMVAFDDVADPRTVRRVDPDNLAATFGPGVELRAVTLEVTGDLVAEVRVESLLGWLGPYPETRLFDNVDPLNFSEEAQMEQGGFIRRTW